MKYTAQSIMALQTGLLIYLDINKDSFASFLIRDTVYK